MGKTQKNGSDFSKTENFMKEITSEKEWNALCEYKVKV